VTVATITQPISAAVQPARSIASRAAANPISLVVSSSRAMCRSCIPVRETIHSSVVSRIFSKSAFVITRSGT
jgi:hypothetical protein